MLALPAFSQQNAFYYGSVATLIGGQAADAYTTLRPNPGVVETNPAGASGTVAIKAATTLALLGFEYLAARHNPERLKKFAWLNYGLGGMFGGFAIYNERLR